MNGLFFIFEYGAFYSASIIEYIVDRINLNALFFGTVKESNSEVLRIIKIEAANWAPAVVFKRYCAITFPVLHGYIFRRNCIMQNSLNNSVPLKFFLCGNYSIKCCRRRCLSGNLVCLFFGYINSTDLTNGETLDLALSENIAPEGDIFLKTSFTNSVEGVVSSLFITCLIAVTLLR